MAKDLEGHRLAKDPQRLATLARSQARDVLTRLGFFGTHGLLPGVLTGCRTLAVCLLVCVLTIFALAARANLLFRLPVCAPVRTKTTNTTPTLLQL